VIKQRSLAMWQADGKHLIPVQPFMDNVIVKSEGSWLIDADGNRILDLASGQFCTTLGHNHPEFVRRLQAELGKTLHTGSQYVTDTVLRAAREVAEITPEGLDTVVFLSTGSEANEFAMRVAKAFTGRSGMAGLDRGYYGITLATRNLSSISGGHVDASPFVPESFHLLAPAAGHCAARAECTTCDLSCLDTSIRMIGERAEGIAAIIAEPIVSAGGMLYPSPEYFARLRAWADEIGALLIIDEAQTGFGRCGKWFDCENLNVRPDILVFSKTSGNGYPVSGVVISRRITERLLDRGFHHLSSHQNDPIAAAAVSAVIDIVRTEKLIDNARDVGAYFLGKLRDMEREFECVSGARGRGLMLAFELVESKESRTPATSLLVPFVLTCKERGVHLTFTYYEGALRIITGLQLTREEVDFAIDVMSSALRDLKAGRVKADAYEQQNPVIRSSNERSTVKRVLNRMWETSPSYWMRRIMRR
jgi:2,2-dialkylglycine decarboxylase (pyruvate)